MGPDIKIQTNLGMRVRTTLLLLPFLFYILYTKNILVFFIFTLIVIAIASNEWCNLFKLKSIWIRFFYIVILFFIIFSVSWFLLPIFNVSHFSMDAVKIIMFVATFFWTMMFFYILMFQFAWIKYKVNKFIYFFLGAFVLVPFAISILFIKQAEQTSGFYYLMYLVSLTIFADTGAYILGKALGHTSLKLASKVSPGKTWIGVFGGLLGVLLVYMGTGFCFDFLGCSPLQLFIITLSVFIFSIIGDLFESLIKRLNKVKDSGTIFPGHGGILDRIDSLLACSPVYCLLLFYFK